MADIDNEVFDNGDEVAIKKVKKPRKPMSLSKKAAFAARMKASREAKKAAKAETKKVVKSALVEVGLKPVEVVEEVQAKQPVRKRNIRHVPNELDSHMELINNLKADIAEMKTMQSSRKDLEEIKALKSELKAIRAQKRKEEKTKDIVVKVKEEVKKEFVKEVPQAKQPVKEVVAPAPVAVAPVQKPRYSTYKKSIWSKLL
tara:strand:+ start:152 stop:754 length:603 start_codon:yes stop_codon:yes gene_type:complete